MFMLSQELLNELFEYKNGDLYWKNHKYKKFNGKKAGSVNGKGYLHTGIKGKLFLNHRIIYVMHHGILPKFIDHMDGNPLNNSIENLRQATHSQNHLNEKMRKDNTSGIKGVTWSKKLKKWVVMFNVNKNPKHFGHYFDIDCAKFVAESMRYKYHEEFARN